jgi:hypothetical protein
MFSSEGQAKISHNITAKDFMDSLPDTSRAI